LHQIREFFTFLDPNNSGSIAPYNARTILTALGKVTTVNEFRQMVYKLNLMQSDFTVEVRRDHMESSNEIEHNAID
jgi:Ca2+-binding EF-hand superfamily protein